MRREEIECIKNELFIFLKLENHVEYVNVGIEFLKRIDNVIKYFENDNSN